MVLDEKEFELFCNEIAKVALEQGIDYESITTILAKAIKNREDELTKQATQEVAVERQLVYGPPPREEVVEVYQAPQLVYGPPQREELIEMIEPPQLVYGPPPRKK